VGGSAIKKISFIGVPVLTFSLCRDIDRPRENGKYYILLDHFEVPAIAQDSMDFSKEAVPL
jgi:hypothetical protein